MENRALGKGLSALIPERRDLPTEKSKRENVLNIKTAQIKDSACQPRTTYNEKKLSELAASIKEKGFLQPILVREKGDAYEVVAGERRLKAARMLNIDEVPAVVKNVSDEEAFVLALIENIQREELNAIEEALAFSRLLEDFSLTYDQIAQTVGKDRSTISNTVRLLKLPDDIQEGIVSGELSMGHARALLSLEDPFRQRQLFKETLSKGLSVRELENLTKSDTWAGGRKRPLRVPKEKHPDIVRLEEELQRVLGTKVRIQAQKKRGKIIIEYYSLEGLRRILEALKK